MQKDSKLWQVGIRSLGECLDDEWGILASDRASNYGTIFGRDSLLTGALLMEAARRKQNAQFTKLVHDSLGTSLRALIKLQGSEERDLNEEQPGKIIHEYWHHPSPRLRRWGWPLIQGRYYGSIDSTPLFVITSIEYLTEFPEPDLYPEFSDAIVRAMQWIERYAFDHPGGLVGYRRRNPSHGVIHQVWKDAGPDTILMPDLRGVPEPIAWIELQAYVIKAARLYRRLRRSHPELPETRIDESRLARHLEHDYFSDQEAGLVMAISETGEQIPLTPSNQGHALWTEALSPTCAHKVAKRLLAPDMLTEYGLRTLSSRSYLYNPWSRQRGAIWPHDNALVALGLARYGFEKEAAKLARAVALALEHFGSAVELYSLIDREEIIDHLSPDKDPLLQFSLPNHEAAKHQAWSAAGALALSTLLTKQ